MEWLQLIPCWVLSVVAFFLAPVLTFGVSSSSSSSSLMSGFLNDSSSSTTSSSSEETRPQVTISLLKSQKHWLKKDIWRIENKKSAAYPLSEDSAEGYYNNSETRQESNIQTNSIYTESCWLGISCEEFSSVAPPHDVIKLIPPPPLPLFLFQLELLPERNNLEEYLYLIDQFDFRSHYLIEKKNDEEIEEKVFRVNPTWLSNDGCSLCKWAKTNFTESLFITHSPKKDDEGNWKWIETLVVVGFVSGVLGAVFACFLTTIKSWIRIHAGRKVENEPPLPGYTADMAYISEAFNRRGTPEDSNLGNNGVNLENCNSQEPQESQGSQGAPSSDSEDTYVNSSSVNLRFSQRASNVGEVEGDSVIYYDPKSLSNRTGAEHCCHNEVSSDLTTSSLNPQGSSSTPSSAYYSDMSVFELPSYRKKKKKKKGDVDRKIRTSNQDSDNYSPTLTNHLVNVKQPLPLCNEVGIDNHTYDEISPQNVTHLSLSSSYPPNKGKCLHNSPNFIQNRTKMPENSYDLCPTTSTTSSTSQYIPKCMHSIPECVRYLPNFALKNTNLSNTSIFQCPYIVNEETVPALIKHFDKGSAIEFINNNITSDCKTKLTNSSKFPEHTEKENCNCFLSSQPSTVLELADDSILAEKKNTPLGQYQQPQLTSCFHPIKDIYRGEQDIYRVYSSSEVPSEYI